MKFSKIDSSYLKKGCRLVWHDPVKDKEQVIFLRSEDLEYLYEVLSKNSTDKIELEDETSSIWIGMFDEEKVKQIVGTDLRPSSILCIGYPRQKRPPKSRRKLKDLIHVIEP